MQKLSYSIVPELSVAAMYLLPLCRIPSELCPGNSVPTGTELPHSQTGLSLKKYIKP